MRHYDGLESFVICFDEDSTIVRASDLINAIYEAEGLFPGRWISVYKLTNCDASMDRDEWFRCVAFSKLRDFLHNDSRCKILV